MSEQTSERWRTRVAKTPDGQLDVRMMRIGELEPYPFNPKRPTARQQEALGEHLGTLGKTRFIAAYYSERNGGRLTLADGHQRQHLDPTEPWPVVILDINDDEAAQEVALSDEIGLLFERDGDKLAQLAQEARAFATGSPALARLWAELADKSKMPLPFAAPAGNTTNPAAGPAPAAGEQPWHGRDTSAPADESYDGPEADEGEGYTPPPSHVRMIQLFLTTETQPAFLGNCQTLQKFFGTNNITDTVVEAIRYACDHIND